MNRLRILIMTVAAAALVAIGLWSLERAFFGPPVITVVNETGYVVSRLNVTGEGFSVSLPDLSTGSQVTTIARPPGESGLAVSFLINGQTVTKDDVAYIEPSGGYVTVVTLRPDGIVNCRTITSFSWRRLAGSLAVPRFRESERRQWRAGGVSPPEGSTIKLSCE